MCKWEKICLKGEVQNLQVQKKKAHEDQGKLISCRAVLLGQNSNMVLKRAKLEL